MTILVDMDDVLEELLSAWVSWLNQRWGTNVRPDDISEWDIAAFFPTIPHHDVFAPLHDDDFWKTVRPKKGAREALETLIEEGHKIYIVTNSSYKALASKMENVLFRYFPFLTWDDVIVTANKQLVNGDVLVDDAVHNLIGGQYARILMDAPYNRSFDAEKNFIRRAKDWPEALAIIRDIKDRIDGIR